MMFAFHDPLTRVVAFNDAFPFMVAAFMVVAPVTPSVDDNVVAPVTPSVEDNEVAPATPNVLPIVTASVALSVDDNAVGISETSCPFANVVIADDMHDRDSVTPPSAVPSGYLLIGSTERDTDHCRDNWSGVDSGAGYSLKLGTSFCSMPFVRTIIETDQEVTVCR